MIPPFENEPALADEVEAYFKSASAQDHFFLPKEAESTPFHGTGDEGIEIFQSLLAAAHKVYGLGFDKWKAVLLVRWAQEFAEDMKFHADPEELEDVEYGQWG